MSSVDLVILGYLMHGDKSAYEMVKEFETWNISRWVKISNPAIYKNIIKLSENGYLEARVVKESEMPEKTIYKINDTGVQYFHKLMREAAEKQENIYFDFSAFVINIGLLGSAEQKELLTVFSNKFDYKSTHMNEEAKKHDDKPKEAKILIEFYCRMIQFINDWSTYLLTEYDQEKS